MVSAPIAGGGRAAPRTSSRNSVRSFVNIGGILRPRVEPSSVPRWIIADSAGTSQHRAGLGTLAARILLDRRTRLRGGPDGVGGGHCDSGAGTKLGLSLVRGSASAGLVCSGGFSSFTPEFEGAELRILSTF